MLMFAGFLCSILAVGLAMLLAFDNRMSGDAPGEKLSKWPAVILAVLAVACFVARHYVHDTVVRF